MSTDSETNSPGAANTTELTQADNIRNAMSFKNLLANSVATPDTTAALVPRPPSTPPKSVKEETSSPVASPDTVMTEPVSTCVVEIPHLTTAHCKMYLNHIMTLLRNSRLSQTALPKEPSRTAKTFLTPSASLYA